METSELESAANEKHRALLPQWANRQDGWCRAIAADVLKSAAQPSDSDTQRYLKLLLAEKKLSEDVFDEVPPIEQAQIDEHPLETVRLNSLKLGEGINALKPGAQIDFGSRVTVIFGENGSGKSGFVRVLKRAAGVRTAEEILHNVRGSDQPSPSASFDVSLGNAETTIPWKNEFGIAPLNRIAVFDVRGARLHVEEDLTYIYTPGELNLFPLVQNAIERVRTNLQSAIQTRRPGTNTLLGSYSHSCSIYSAIETLGPATDLDEIRQYGTSPDDLDASIEDLNLEINALQSTNIRNELRRLRDRRNTVGALESTVILAAQFDLHNFATLIQNHTDAAARLEAAGSKAFENSGIPSVMGDEWEVFIQVAEEYIAKHAESDYPSLGSPCVYCRQPLDVAAVELVRKYREFSNGEWRKQLETAKSELDGYSATLLTLEVDELVAELGEEAADEQDVLSQLKAVANSIRDLKKAVASRVVCEWNEKAAELASAGEILDRENQRLRLRIAELEQTAEQRENALKQKQAILTELVARSTTKSLLPQIEKRVSDAKWVSKATIIEGNLTGILRTLTDAAKEASEELLNKDFGKRFEAECQLLRAPEVTLNFPGRQGQVARRKLLGSHKPTEVLSEGELKALALADFLSEVTAVPSSSPVIFDDPITSMDYRRIHEVSDRIIALSREHQCVIFTHNIWFAAELLSKADRGSWKYFDIRQEGGTPGIVSVGDHPRVDTIKQIAGRVTKLIEAANRESDGVVRGALVEKGYEELRGFCEVVVEQELFKGVIQRYAPNVMMTKLDKINIEKFPEALAAIVPVFEKSCRYIASHSQPIETQGIRPTLDELKKDLEKISAARQFHKE